MILKYIQTAMELAHYEIIDDQEPFYGEIRKLRGVWASGSSLEECRANLESALEGWLIVRLRKGLGIPSLNGCGFQPAIY